MKIKFILSSLALMLFALLGGGSFDGEKLGIFLIIILIVVGMTIVVAMISSTVQSNNKKKRLQMIQEDEKQSTDFDRSVFIGDDHCKIYFDSTKKQVMILGVTSDEIKKEFIDDFEFPGKDLAIYKRPEFYIFDPIKRRMLSGSYDELRINYQITSIAEKDKNNYVAVNNSIPPQFKSLITQKTTDSGIVRNYYNILIDESHGLMAFSESGCVKNVFNYINEDILPKKRGNLSSITTKSVGNYLFVMDDFFDILVFFGPKCYEIFNYSDILEVSYVENGSQLFTKSAGRTVGGAIIGGVLMGGAGAIVGGLSGGSKQNKEIKNMNIKILLRNTSRNTCVLFFKSVNRILNTKNDYDRKLYESYLHDANQAKDVFSVIIDKAKQAGTPTAQPISSKPWSVADELTKLAKLKSDGFLTDEEFQIQKAKLLG